MLTRSDGGLEDEFGEFTPKPMGESVELGPFEIDGVFDRVWDEEIIALRKGVTGFGVGDLYRIGAAGDGLTGQHLMEALRTEPGQRHIADLQIVAPRAPAIQLKTQHGHGDGFYASEDQLPVEGCMSGNAMAEALSSARRRSRTAEIKSEHKRPPLECFEIIGELPRFGPKGREGEENTGGSGGENRVLSKRMAC